ncbi:MAG: HAMP domain-containing histidine kinase [Okeania sp. SIO2F4]|uniref:sensor histidine kinase n=1 Tax=Okeania sp. SIO2F4 TaxID=2607790 RepID=UPI00142933CC|nr:HAMP domain-containing sensor histidine kinase [Okeania sp. SIO2F4]NES03002.1 HAMP domain-containing histidine kinase [Okeania sp. SIO2F4]
MKFLLKWPKKLKFGQFNDSSSLQTRLTVGIAVFSVLGLGSVALWTSWKMQQLLVVSHKHNIEQIAKRFPKDVEMYSKMWYPKKSLQKAIDNLTLANVFLWVKSQDGNILAESQSLRNDIDHFILKSLTEMPLESLVYPINGRYFVLCGGPITVNGMSIGKLYIALDITRDQKMLVTMVMSLSVASILAIVVVTVAITIYIQRSLIPLCQISRFADNVNADRLAEARVSLEQAPSEVKQLAKTLDTMLGRLSDSWEQQRQFVSNVSHELRTPLTIVSGYLQSILRRGNNLTETQKEAILVASGEAQRTIELLKDLLELARADSGQIHFHLESVLLNDLVAEVVEMAKQCSDREIILRLENGGNIVNQEKVSSFSKNEVLTGTNNLVCFDFDNSNKLSSEINLDDNYLGSGLSLKSKSIPQVKQSYVVQSRNLSLIEVIVDPNRLKQVLLNLIDNAVKYSEPDSPVILNVYQKGGEAIIQVCDEGKGIPLSQQAKIFERFYRGDEARNRSGNGAGLGLSIVQTLVEGMGGNIQVYSKLDQGSVFTVKFQLKK